MSWWWQTCSQLGFLQRAPKKSYDADPFDAPMRSSEVTLALALIPNPDPPNPDPPNPDPDPNPNTRSTLVSTPTVRLPVGSTSLTSSTAGSASRSDLAGQTSRMIVRSWLGLGLGMG